MNDAWWLDMILTGLFELKKLTLMENIYVRAQRAFFACFAHIRCLFIFSFSFSLQFNVRYHFGEFYVFNSINLSSWASYSIIVELGTNFWPLSSTMVVYACVCIYCYRLFCAVTPSAIRKITKGDFYCIITIMNKFQTSVPMTMWNNDKIKREKERRKTAIYLKGHSQPTHDPIEKFNFLMILNIGFILCSVHRLECGTSDMACA